jgi:oxidase EvaA
MQMWHLDLGKNIRHDSGKFFSIEGIRVNKIIGDNITSWDQPIINQPEIGILGIVCKEINGILHFLLQAKIEPGNVNVVQLSPTVQATRSNYTKVHKGSTPHYLEYFLEIDQYEIVVDQLQSEQGARFLKKRNRNIIIKINDNDNLKLEPNFCWLTLKQIYELIKIDNLINMDTRTVLSCIHIIIEDELFLSDLLSRTSNNWNKHVLNSLFVNSGSKYSFVDIISWITRLKSESFISIKNINISDLNQWVINEYEIEHVEKRFFKVIAVNALIENREVSTWFQPLIEQRQSGLTGFIAKNFDGILHFLVQARVEAGNLDILELAPTVQCITGNYLKPDWEIPYLEYFVNQKDSNKIVYSTVQSEEGGRFYHDQNKNIIILLSDEENIVENKNYKWMSLLQIKHFIQFNNYFNIEARSLLSSILS